jgi:hypothetical protein
MIQLDENFDLEAVRERLRRAALLRWGQAAARLSSQREIFRLQAEAAREEWRRDISDRTETVQFRLEDPVRMLEGRIKSRQRHRSDAGEAHAILF